MEPIRVLIVDDHALFTDALTARLNAEPDLVVLPPAGDSRRALALLATERPDVVVLDLMLGQESGLDLLDRIRERDPAVRVVILTALACVDGAHSTGTPDAAGPTGSAGSAGPAGIVAALRRGAVGWLSKTEAADQLVRVVRGAAGSGGWIPPEVLGDVLRRLLGPVEPDDGSRLLAGLTPREGEILQCLVDGRGRAGIAERLGLSANTVRTHIQNLLAKLGTHSALEAITVAMRSGMRPAG